MRYSRIGLWAVAATVAVAVTTTVVATATGAAGREVLSEEGVADALAAVGPAGGAGARSAPVGAPDASTNSADSASDVGADGDDKLLQTSAGDIVASCGKDVLAIRSVAPKPGYRTVMVEIGRDSGVKALRWTNVIKRPADGPVWISVGPSGRLALVFDKASSEVSIKVELSCVDGVPTAKESEIVKNYGAGRG